MVNMSTLAADVTDTVDAMEDAMATVDATEVRETAAAAITTMKADAAVATMVAVVAINRNR